MKRKGKNGKEKHPDKNEALETLLDLKIMSKKQEKQSEENALVFVRFQP